MDKQSYGQDFIFHTDLKDLQVRHIIAREEEFWDTMISRYHYLGAYTPYNENFVHTWALKEPVVRSQEPDIS